VNRLSWCVAVLVLATTAAFAGADMNAGKVDPASKPKPRNPEAVYKVVAGLDGEIFPMFANYASLQSPRDRQWGTVTVTVTNPTDAPLTSRIAAQIVGWSDQEIQVVEVGAGQVRTLQFAPSFLPRLYQNHEIAAATALVSITDMGGKPVHTSTIPVRLRAADDIYWGAHFKYGRFIASWVTPHDPRVEAVLTRAKEYAPRRRLPGYEDGKTAELQERSTYVQAQAIYRALQEKGISYVKSSSTLGSHINAHFSERIRMPHDSLQQVSANCIDGAVLFASLFENLGLEPVVVLVPGHAYVGVRVAENSKRYLYIETSLTGRATFEAAVNAAQRGLARYSASRITRIPISEARQAGIYPMPAPARQQATSNKQLATGNKQ